MGQWLMFFNFIAFGKFIIWENMLHNDPMS